MARRPKRAVVSSYAATRMVNKGVAAFMNVSAFEARLRQSSGIDKSVPSRILCSRMCATGSLEGQPCYMRKNVRMSVIVLSCVIAGMVAQKASAAIKLPPCPEGVVDKKTCECRAFVSSRYHVCRAGQYCLRNAFHGMCW